ncbi:MAG: hypothetical protein ACK5RS_01860, partial [Acidobacteriota bacterium]
LPEYVQWLAWVVPVTAVVDVARELMAGRFTVRMLLEIPYVILSSMLMTELAMRALRRRMVA